MNVIDVLNHRYAQAHAADRVYGVVVAVVTAIDDPDGLGRVKVTYPWLQKDSESPWVRVASFMGGNDRGAVFRPEIEDEVLVAFELGDMRRPFIIGALHNGVDAMPSERAGDADNDVRLIKSRSGHTLVFDDKDGEEKITITDKAGNVIELNADGVTITSDAIKIGTADSSEGLVLGDALLELFNQHTHPTGVGPSGPTTQPMVKGTHVSEKHTTE